MAKTTREFEIGADADALQAFMTDPALVGKFAHFVAVDGGSLRGSGDMFSVHVTEAGVHDHAKPVPVLWGNLVVRAPAM